MSHYETLGVKRDASADEIRRAYRAKRSKAHPDHGGKEKTFHALVRAYETLSDQQRREKYDAGGGDEEGPDPHLMALGSIAATLISLLEMPGAENVDAIAMLKNHFQKERENLIRSRMKYDKQAEMLTGQAKRFTRKTKGRNVLADMIHSQAAACRNAALANTAKIGCADEIMKILGEYECATAEAMRADPRHPLGVKMFYSPLSR